MKASQRPSIEHRTKKVCFEGQKIQRERSELEVTLIVNSEKQITS